MAVLNLCPSYGTEADQAAKALKTLGLDVCKQRIANRASARRAYALHQSILEFEPFGKAAQEFVAVFRTIDAFRIPAAAHPARAEACHGQ